MAKRASMFSDLNLPPIEEASTLDVPAVPATTFGATASATLGAGRRGNPAYRQFSAYVPDGLYRQFKSKLALDNRDLSEVMEDLIAKWVNG